MLNEFSDRGPNRKRKPFIMSGEFWLGVATVLIGSMLVLGFLV
jgi:hypothetical protein